MAYELSWLLPLRAALKRISAYFKDADERITVLEGGGGGGGVPEAPNDGQDYVRKSEAWAVAGYFSGAYADLSGKPSLATVATSGDYNDLSNLPTLPGAYWEPGVSSDHITLVSGIDRVGIGTSTPAADLHIQSATDPEIRMTSVSASHSWEIRINDTTGRLTFFPTDGANATTGGIKISPSIPENFLRMGALSDDSFEIRGELTTTGNVGIGTTAPGRKLEAQSSEGVVAALVGTNVNGRATIGFEGSGTTGGDNQVVCGALDDDFIIQTSAATRLIVDTAGNVRVLGLAGTGSRFVVADADGDLGDIAYDSLELQEFDWNKNQFDVDGNGPGEQNDGLYVADLGGTVGDTDNPAFTLGIFAQTSSARSIGLAVDTESRVHGFRSHSGAGPHTFKPMALQSELPDETSIAKSKGDNQGQNYSNTTATPDWLAPIGLGTEVTWNGSLPDRLTAESSGFYRVRVTIRVQNNNRTELQIMLVQYRSIQDDFVDLTDEIINDYVSRDSDQDKGALTLETEINLQEGDGVLVDVTGDCDGTCTGIAAGTSFMMEKIGPLAT